MPVEFWIAPFVALALTQIAALATSVYLHRTLAHRALAVHPLADTLFRAVLWLTTGQDRRQWVAVHRKHHAFTDRDGDPHSPRLLGFWRVQLLNVYYYAREARKSDTLRRFAPDLAEEFAQRLGVPLEPMAFDAPNAAIAALRNGAADITFLAPTRERAALIDFGPPFMEMEMTLIVPPSSPITATVRPTGTSPDSTAIFSSTPLASASTSWVTFSVSTS